MMRPRAATTSTRGTIAGAARRAPACQALGLSLLAPDSPSPAATAVKLPTDVDGSALFRYLRDKMQRDVRRRPGPAEGQDHPPRRTSGYVGAFDVIVGLAALELALTHFGAKVELGRGVGAAEKILGEGLPARG